jgi:GTP-binding protein HflX
MVTVFNKMDLLPDRSLADNLVERTPQSVSISAATGENLSGLLRLVGETLSSRRLEVDLTIPQERSELLSLIQQRGKILQRRYEDGNVIIQAELDRRIIAQLREFIAGQV